MTDHHIITGVVLSNVYYTTWDGTILLVAVNIPRDAGYSVRLVRFKFTGELAVPASHLPPFAKITARGVKVETEPEITKPTYEMTSFTIEDQNEQTKSN
jgi:hypothetical protein